MSFDRVSRSCFVVVAGALAALVVAHLLWSAWCAFTWSKYQLYDYGMYSNMMWNTAHGAPFRMLVDRTYFTNHVSFTMGLAGFAFWIWDHPFMPALLQWLMLAGGCVLVAVIAHRRGLPAEAVVALPLFYAMHPFTQAAMLSELRGVNLYYLLYPWLFYCLSFARRWTPLPLALLLGTREDSLMLAAPLLFYMAARDRWRGGYIYGTIALAYGVVAITVLFPWLSGQTLVERRLPEWSGRLQTALSAPPLFLEGHLKKLPLLLLPAATALWRGSRPLFVLPSLVYLLSLAMVYARGDLATFRHHYGGTVLITLTLGILEAWGRRRDLGDAPRLHIALPHRAMALAALAVALHLQAGFITSGGKTDRFYQVTFPDGGALLRAASHVSREGLLVVDRVYAAYFANRRDLIDWRRFSPRRHQLKTAFVTLSDLADISDGRLRRALISGAAGVRYFDGDFVAVEWGAPVDDNEFVLLSAENPEGALPIGRTFKRKGEEVAVAGAQRARYWHGNGSRAPAALSFGGYRHLGAGPHCVLLRYRAVKPLRDVRGNWGRVSLHRLGEQDALVDCELDRVETPPGQFHVMEIPLELDREGDIEIRVTAGDAELWLHRAIFTSPPAAPIDR